MAEDAVSCELFSAKFPANREENRENRALSRTSPQLSNDKRAC